MDSTTARKTALFSAALATHAAGVTWSSVTAGAAFLEEITQRVSLAVGEHASEADLQALVILTPTDAEEVLFCLDQFEA